jgi:hypothetical protein
VGVFGFSDVSEVHVASILIVENEEEISATLSKSTPCKDTKRESTSIIIILKHSGYYIYHLL